MTIMAKKKRKPRPRRLPWGPGRTRTPRPGSTRGAGDRPPADLYPPKFDPADGRLHEGGAPLLRAHKVHDPHFVLESKANVEPTDDTLPDIELIEAAQRALR